VVLQVLSMRKLSGPAWLYLPIVASLQTYCTLSHNYDSWS
jgi:hypothetical protein